MAKNLGKDVRKMKNKSGDAKRKAVHKMVEALIKGDSDTAADELHAYLQLKTNSLLLGEKKEETEDDDKDDDKDDKDSDDKDDDKDDKDSDDDKKKSTKSKKKDDDDSDEDDD